MCSRLIESQNKNYRDGRFRANFIKRDGAIILPRVCDTAARYKGHYDLCYKQELSLFDQMIKKRSIVERTKIHPFQHYTITTAHLKFSLTQGNGKSLKKDKPH